MIDQQEPAQALARHITGIETEFDITLTLDGSRRLGPDEIARYMFCLVIAKYGATNIFAPNTGRIYLNVGSHPEYATAECDSVSQLVAYDRSGEVILSEFTEKTEAELTNESIDGKVYLLKNNVDTVGNSHGCHENYLVGRELGPKSLSELLLPFLITCQLICDVEKVFLPYPTSPYHNDPIQYCFSQRVDYMWEDISSAAAHSRPIINTHDELHAGSNRFRRLHVIVGDSNMSGTTTALKVGSTQLILEMIETGVKLSNPEVANEIKSIRTMSRDMTGKVEIPLRSGETAIALQIQRKFLDAMTEWLKVREKNMANRDEGIAGAGTSDEEMSHVVELWGRTLDAVETSNWSLIEYDIDWAIKYSLMKRYLDRGLMLKDPKLHQIDLAYHNIRPGRGIPRALEARDITSRWITDEQAAEAVHIAPPTTYARLHGDFLITTENPSLKAVVDWTHLKISGDDPISTMLGDPFATENDEVNEMIEILTTAKKTSGTNSSN